MACFKRRYRRLSQLRRGGKTWRSLRNLARDPGLSFEWIVVDGGSEDGTREFLQKRHGEFNLRFISEKDRGIYDAMNKGIALAQGAIPCFLIPVMRSMMMPRCLSANWRDKGRGDVYWRRAAGFWRRA